MAKRSTARSTTKSIPPAKKRDDLLDAERKANRDEPRNFKEDALTDKVTVWSPTEPALPWTETDPQQDRKGDPNKDRHRCKDQQALGSDMRSAGRFVRLTQGGAARLCARCPQSWTTGRRLMRRARVVQTAARALSTRVPITSAWRWS